MLLALILLAYGLLAAQMGFYWDDLPFAWILRFFGPMEFIAAFRPFRPLLGPIFAVTTTLFGGNPLTWQALGLLARLALGLQALTLTRKVFPAQRRSAWWVAALFTLYPAYGQQWAALTHVNQELIPLLFLLASFIITISILRAQKHVLALSALAIILQCLGLFSTEYFFGLEILRFLFIWVVLAESTTERVGALKKSLARWSPYLAIWIVNAVWTYAYHRSSAYNSYEISALGGMSALGLINEFISTFSLSAFTAWIGAFDIFSVMDGSLTQTLALVVLCASAGVAFLGAQTQAPPQHSEAEAQRAARQFIGIGFVGILAGRLPSWAAGLPLKIAFDYDRFFVAIMLGASLFIIGLANLLLKEQRAKAIFLSLLIGVSAARQFATANTFRRDWSNEQALFWEMAWRMPALQDGVVLLTYELPIQYAADYQLSAPLNWMYAPDLQTHRLPHMLLYLKSRFTLAEIRAEQPIEIQYRTATFSGGMSDSVVIYKEAGGCLRVLDPLYNNAQSVPNAAPHLARAIALSNPDLIRIDAPAPKMDSAIFGTEPTRGWCYLYAQAEIARQRGDWGAVVRIYKEAQKAELTPALAVEYFPFIEAFARADDMETSLALSERVVKEQPLLCPALRTLWERISATDDPSEAERLLEKNCLQ